MPKGSPGARRFAWSEANVAAVLAAVRDARTIGEGVRRASQAVGWNMSEAQIKAALVRYTGKRLSDWLARPDAPDPPPVVVVSAQAPVSAPAAPPAMAAKFTRVPSASIAELDYEDERTEPRGDDSPMGPACLEHPTYQAFLEPRRTELHPDGCHRCWDVWRWRQRQREPELTTETEPAAERAAPASVDVEHPSRVAPSQSDVKPPAYVPRPPRGPAEKPHYIPIGHELGGVSRLIDANGNLLQEWGKTRVAGADEAPVPVPPQFLLDRASVMRRGDGSTVVEWASYKRDAVARWEAIKEAVVEHLAEYVCPVLPTPCPESADSDRLVCYPIGDPHIGMMAWANEVGESFDLKIAERELRECFVQLVARSPATEEAIVTNLGDFWHADDASNRTPKSGNRLDVDGRFGKIGRVGLGIFRAVIDTCLQKHARVRVRSIPGNHDPTSSFWLPLCLSAVYENEPRVLIEDGFNPYQFDVFGDVLLGWAHGDGAKLEDLGEIMATDEAAKWGAAKHRYWNTGHIHHWSQKELRGCFVDTHRTLAGRDAWHHHSGYRSGQALKAPVYHRIYGLDSVSIVGIERVRAALSASGDA